MSGVTRMFTAPRPAAPQIIQQEAQQQTQQVQTQAQAVEAAAAATAAETKRITEQERAAEATRRAQLGRSAGRLLLLNDEVGQRPTPVQQRLGA